jgi:predicted AAA+ superfamily ATPase
MPVAQTTRYPDANPPTPESVWAFLQELGRKQEEYALHLKETERISKEEYQRDKNEFNERLGAITNLFGDLTEAMVAPRICEKFEELGLIFPKANRNTRVNDRVNKISLEVDIMLENGDKAMLIEVKTKLTIERIKYHLNRLEEMRKYANLHGDKRAFLGAVAGIVVTDKARDYALKHGLYFIEYAGENFYITPPGDQPREW